MTFNRKFAIVTLSLALTFGVHAASAQDGRRAVKNPSPAYPEMAKQMHVAGAVKLEVSVNPSGHVTAVKVLGGHPLLASSAERTIRNWVYEPSPEHTVEQVTVNFN